MTLTFLLFQLITHEEKRERIYEADFRYVRSEVDKKTGLPNLCTKYDQLSLNSLYSQLTEVQINETRGVGVRLFSKREDLCLFLSFNV